MHELYEPPMGVITPLHNIEMENEPTVRSPDFTKEYYCFYQDMNKLSVVMLGPVTESGLKNVLTVGWHMTSASQGWPLMMLEVDNLRVKDNMAIISRPPEEMGYTHIIYPDIGRINWIVLKNHAIVSPTYDALSIRVKRFFSTYAGPVPSMWVEPD